MNKIYKLVWSKTKNMYVAVAEYAKSHTKAPKSGIISRTVITGVLATVLGFGMIHPVYALDYPVVTRSYNTGSYDVNFFVDENNKTVTGVQFVYSVDNYDITDVYTFSTGSSGSGGTTYTAGNGITISGDTISAKAGTNVTVNSNGISVTGNGSVASGNTGLIDGGKLYTEVRPSDNGNYVKHKNSI